MPPTITCPSCRTRQRHYARGWCQDCYRRAYQRKRWASMPRAAREARLRQMREAEKRRREKIGEKP